MSTVGDLAPALAWLAEHPDLPIPLGGGVVVGAGPATDIHVVVDTEEQVDAWAAALGVSTHTRWDRGAVTYAGRNDEPPTAFVVAVTR